MAGYGHDGRRLERDIGGRPLCRSARHGESSSRQGPAARGDRADPDDLTVLDDEAADRRIFGSPAQGPPADAQACAIWRSSSLSRRAVIVAQLTQHLFEILGLAEIAIDRGRLSATSSRVLNPSADEIADGLRGNIGCTVLSSWRTIVEIIRSTRSGSTGRLRRDLDRTHQLVAIEGTRRPDRLTTCSSRSCALSKVVKRPPLRTVPTTADGRAVL